MSNFEDLKEKYGNSGSLIKRNLLYALAGLGMLAGFQVIRDEHNKTMEREYQRVEADVAYIVDSLFLKNAAIKNMQILNLGSAVEAALPQTKEEVKSLELKARENEKYSEARGLRRAFSIRTNQIHESQAQGSDMMPLIYSMEKNAGRTLDSYKVVSTLPVFEHKVRAFIAKAK